MNRCGTMRYWSKADVNGCDNNAITIRCQWKFDASRYVVGAKSMRCCVRSMKVDANAHEFVKGPMHVDAKRQNVSARPMRADVMLYIGSKSIRVKAKR